jgi:hypothetical protein
MIGLLAVHAVDLGFEPQLRQTKDYKNGICCFSATKHATLMSKSKDWFARNWHNVSIEQSVYLQTVASELALLKT